MYVNLHTHIYFKTNAHIDIHFISLSTTCAAAEVQIMKKKVRSPPRKEQNEMQSYLATCDHSTSRVVVVDR